MLPAMAAIGGLMGLGGIAGAYASGAMGSGPQVSAPTVRREEYQWGGSPEEMQREINYQEARRNQAWDQGQGARQGQADAAGMYRDMASGRGPSAGQAMLAAGMTRANADAGNLAASARGGGGSQQAAMRRALDVQAQGAASAANQSAMLRAQEQQAGIAGLAGVSGAMRGADGQMYGMAQDAQQRIYSQDLEARMRRDEAMQRGSMWADQINQGGAVAAQERKARLWGGLASGGGSMMGMGLGG